ncbi:TonB family protein [Neisseria montereyensis]|uniref:TonB family protein n=1 Tax=Neisseria montereyensis TaxID=2973938 RepID=A0ABT2FC42_9NEIS|nr:TonB family protein [Neisseria montereyensis]MCS4533702.1 TonB family protein [Neisseria montereyensis]
MKIKHVLSTLTAFALFAGAQTALAQTVTFHDNHVNSQTDGNVAMSIDISPSGKVSDARIVRSSGSATIDAEAISWIQSQYMRPVTMNGDNIQFSVIKEFKFSKTAPVQQAGLAF